MSSADGLTSFPREVIKRDGAVRRSMPEDPLGACCAPARPRENSASSRRSGLLTAQVTKVLIHSLRGAPPDIERIQDIVEQTLIAANHLATARAYIAYRESHKKLREDRKTLVDVEASVNEYLSRQDWRVNANANQGYAGRPDPQRVRARWWPTTGSTTSTRPSSARRIATARSTSTTSTCWRATAPAGRCARCCTKA
jgi:hypothetical protein